MKSTEYIPASVTLYFEKDHVACEYCPLLETYSRNQCRRTGEYIIYPKSSVGEYCPLELGTDVRDLLLRQMKQVCPEGGESNGSEG